MRKLMGRAFASVDRFICFSQIERSLYARHFDLDPARIDTIHWAAQSSPGDALARPLVATARAIERLWQDPAATRALGDAGRTFAANHCGEDAVVVHFENYLHTRARPPKAASSTDDSKKGDLR